MRRESLAVSVPYGFRVGAWEVREPILARNGDGSGTRVTLSAPGYASSLGSFDNRASAVHG
ncbi:hypothetical protein ACFXOY_00920 [Streptomyces niveus]|uniref:hypothetical protein n=1 Tax=Streptomyces niveus TaxID=193462 RepID=UPI0036A709BD